MHAPSAMSQLPSVAKHGSKRKVWEKWQFGYQDCSSWSILTQGLYRLGGKYAEIIIVV